MIIDGNENDFEAMKSYQSGRTINLKNRCWSQTTLNSEVES